MATVYKIKIKTVSPWVNYPEKEIQKLFENFVESLEDVKTRNKFESTEVEVKRE